MSQEVRLVRDPYFVDMNNIHVRLIAPGFNRAELRPYFPSGAVGNIHEIPMSFCNDFGGIDDLYVDPDGDMVVISSKPNSFQTEVFETVTECKSGKVLSRTLPWRIQAKYQNFTF